MHQLALAIMFFLLALNSLRAQDTPPKHVFPLWTYHQHNINIHGMSLGLASWLPNEPRDVTTNGIKVELIGIGFLMPLIDRSPVSQSSTPFGFDAAFPPFERNNGISLSTSGTSCDCIVNGVALSGVGQYYGHVNGLSAAFMMNFAELHHGVQVAMMLNESNQTRGLQVGMFTLSQNTKGVQVGVYNQSKKLKGIQIGLWNKNQKRSLPILNWSF